MKTMLFNPYSGLPRHPSDIASDPEGILMVDPDEPVRAYVAPQPAVERQPLTERQAYEVIAATVGQAEPFKDVATDGPEWSEFMKFVRAFEAAHGITPPATKGATQ